MTPNPVGTDQHERPNGINRRRPHILLRKSLLFRRLDGAIRGITEYTVVIFRGNSVGGGPGGAFIFGYDGFGVITQCFKILLPAAVNGSWVVLVAKI